MGQFLEEEGGGTGGDKGVRKNVRGDREKHGGSRRQLNRRKSKRRLSRRSSSFGVTSLAERDEDELMQVYKEGQSGVSEEDIIENIQTQKEIIDNVKSQPWRMGKKLKMLKLARAYVEKFEGKLSRGQGYQQKWRTFFRQLKRSYNNLIASLVPWEMRIKTIESHFGSVVASYFVFLRWLIWINIWLTFLPLCFIIIPELIVGAPHGSLERKQIPTEEEETGADLKTIWDAEGIVKYSVVFYGYYGNVPVIGNGYRLPLAYMLTSLASFALSFIFVLKTMANNSRLSRMSTKDEHFTFSWKLFTEWDYMIANKETANSKHASLVTTFREAILEEEEKVKEGNKHLLLFLRILGNVMVLLSLALSTYIIQLFVDRSREMEIRKRQDKDYVAGFWAENELTVVMTMIATMFPNILDLISLMEKYHPRTNLRLQLARIFALNLLNLYTLFIALYNKQDDLKKEIQSQIDAQMASIGNGTILCNTTISTTPTTLTANTTEAPHVNCTNPQPEVDSDLCWETMIGQEVFKLTVMDLIFTLGQIIIIDYIRGVFVRYANSICCWDMEKKFPEYPEFKTAENLLHLINNQGVIWLGTFFAPGLPVLNMFKLMIMVYVRCWSVMVCNVPQERIFRASRSNNFYYALLLVMLFLCMLPPLFAIVGVDPSPGCGPFSNQQKMFYVLTEAMEKGLPPSFNAVLDYAASPGVIIPIFLLLLMTIYYLVSVGRSLRESNNELRMQLEYERTEGRRKVYAMADAKREVEGDGKDGVKLNKGKKKNMSNAVSSLLAATRLSKVMGQSPSPNAKSAPPTQPKPTSLLAAMRLAKAMAEKEEAKDADQSAPSPRQQQQTIPVAVVQGKRSIKDKVMKEKLMREAFKRRGQDNPGYDQTGDEDREHVVTNGSLIAMMAKTAPKRQSRPKPLKPEVVQNIDHEEGSTDEEVTALRQSRSMENRPKPNANKLLPSNNGRNLLAKPKEKRSRSRSRDGDGREGRSSSNTSVEVINETVQAEVNMCPPANVKKSKSKTRQRSRAENIQSQETNISQSQNPKRHRSRDNIRSPETSDTNLDDDIRSTTRGNVRQTETNNIENVRNNLSAKRNVTKSIPRITVEDCSDDNTSLADVEQVVADDTESESDTTDSSEDNDADHSRNVSSAGVQNSSGNVSVDDLDSPRGRNFASLLARFRESESEGVSSDDQNSPEAIAARNRFTTALSRFKKK